MSGDDPSASEQTDIVPFDPDQWPTLRDAHRRLARHLTTGSSLERSVRDRSIRTLTYERDRSVQTRTYNRDGEIEAALSTERTRIKPIPARIRQRLHPAASIAHDIDGSDRHDRLTLPHRGSVALACTCGLIVVSDVGPGRAQVDYDDTLVDVTLQVTEDIEIHDGTLLFVGGLWFRYECDDVDQTPLLQLLDADGNPQVMVAVRDESFVVGRERGDLILPNARDLAAVHLQIMRAEDRTFLRSLAESGDTWSIVPPGAIIPSTCTLAVGDRLVRLHPPSPLDLEPTMAEPGRRHCA
ncbi:MAG: hypothetical protein AAGF11_20635 [Myxococcota bacterium]